jgi:hypothetical protein
LRVTIFSDSTRAVKNISPIPGRSRGRTGGRGEGDRAQNRAKPGFAGIENPSAALEAKNRQMKILSEFD